MKPRTDIAAKRAVNASLRTVVGAVALIALLAAMIIDTKVVAIGSDADVTENAFQPERYGRAQFPEIRQSVEARAVDARTLAAELAEDRAAAAQEHGVGDGIGPVVPVEFTGTAGAMASGIYTVHVDGVPDDTTIRVQTGPAINGTDLRDATGEIAFGQFKNQIEYQDAGAAINDAMKDAVLSDIDTAALGGKTLTVVGVFKLINPKNWLVTPVRIDVQ